MPLLAGQILHRSSIRCGLPTLRQQLPPAPSWKTVTSSRSALAAKKPATKDSLPTCYYSDIILLSHRAVPPAATERSAELLERS